MVRSTSTSTPFPTVSLLNKRLKPTFRQCRETDREWAYALKSESYREVVERQFGPWNEEFQRALFATRWKAESSRIIILKDTLVGLIAMENREEHLWLDELQIAREWRGRGLGSLIIRDLLAQAKATQKPLRLQVLKSNDRAEALYRRLGFMAVSESETHLHMEFR